MEGTERVAELERLLHMVESAQRAGYTENEIVEVVEHALEADAQIDRAA